MTLNSGHRYLYLRAFDETLIMNANLRNYKLILLTRLHILGLFVCCAAFIIIESCSFEENFVSNAPLQVRFSVDTLSFDTVFTSIGSATRSFSIANLSEENVIVESIKMENGASSMFRMNVDGVPTDDARDVKILANDSIYVFVEVTVDPDQPLSISPFIIAEEITVSSGGRQDQVTLTAFGQNANYFPSKDAKGQLISLTCNNSTIRWDDPRPYVVYGLLFIDSCGLEIPKGTQVYVHGGLARVDETIFNDGGLFFLPEGKLRTEGTVDEPVVFQGARLESAFSDQSGQWAGIRMLSGSKGHELRHTTIKNSIVGIRADSAAEVNLESVQIFNTSSVGLIGIHSNLTVDNSLIHSNGPQSVALTFGGNYRFRHCTLANYENQRAALYMDNFNCLDEDCNSVEVFPMIASFQNSIIMGSNKDEVVVNDISEGAEAELLQIEFDHTLIRVDESKAFYPASACINCLEYMDEPVFENENEDLYRLDTFSLAKSQGRPLMGLELDLNGVARDIEQPDLGCYEFVD